MESKKEFKLADGDYRAAEAKTLLLGLINGKMNFHNVEAMKSLESENGNFKNCQNTLNDLKRTKQELSALLQELESKGLSVQLKCNLEIVVQEEVLA